MLKKIFGFAGERAAVHFLKKGGYEILRSNYRCPFGEVDIIAEKGDIIVFVEVKSRSSERFGLGFESVDRIKQRKIIKCAEYYLTVRKVSKLCRFDIISIDGGEIRHIINAFGR